MDLGAISTSIRLNISNFTTNMRLVEDNLRATEQRLSGITSIGDRFSAVGGKLTMGLTMPIVGLGGACIKFFSDFESGMAKISTVADATQKPIKQMGEEIKELSNATGMGTGDLQAGLYDVLSAGVATSESIEYLGVAVKAARGGFTDTATAVDGLTSTLNAYGLAASEANKIANQMMVTQNLGKTTFGELSSVIGQVAPIANALSVTTDELFSSLAVLTANGIKTAQATTGLKAAFSGMIKPSKEATDAAEAMGLQFDANTVKAKGLMPFLQDIKAKVAEVAPAYGKMAEAQATLVRQMTELEKAGKKNSTEFKALSNSYKANEANLKSLEGASKGPLSGLATMFGSVEALNTILTLTSSQGMELYNESMGQMGDGIDRVDDAFNKMSDTAGVSLSMSLNSLKNSGIAFGEALIPLFTKVSEIIGNLAKAIQSMSPAEVQMAVNFLMVVAAVGPLLLITGKLITSTATIIGLFSNVSTAILSAGGVLPAISALGVSIWTALAPLLPFIAAFAAIAAVFGLVYKAHKDQQEQVKKTKEAYDALHKTIASGNKEELTKYRDKLVEQQKTLDALIKKVNDFKKANNETSASYATSEANFYILALEKEGLTVDHVTGKIKELSEIRTKLYTVEEIDRIRTSTQASVDESVALLALINKYNDLLGVKNRTAAQDIELSNTAKELNNKYKDLKITLDNNGRALVSNITVLGQKKTALEIDIQMIKQNAYEQSKAAIFSEEVEIGKTKMTISQIEARIAARKAENYDFIGPILLSPEEQLMQQASRSAQARLKEIKATIDKITIPSAPSGSFSSGSSSIPKYTSSGSDFGSSSSAAATKNMYDVGIEGATQYAKFIGRLNFNLAITDDKIKDIQNKIQTSSIIGTPTEMLKITEEQTNLYKAQGEALATLKTAEKNLSDNKKKLIAEFKNSYGALKNVDMSKWEEADFNNFIEKTYQRASITDKARSEALAKGLKYAQTAVSDLNMINAKAEEVQDKLISVRNEQLTTLNEINQKAKELSDAIAEENYKQVQGLTDGLDNMLSSITDSLRANYEKRQKLDEQNVTDQINNIAKIKDENFKSLDTIYNAKVAALDKELALHDKTVKAEDDNLKVNTLRTILNSNYSSKKKKETQIELDKLLKDMEEKKYKDSLQATREQLKIDYDLERGRLEATGKINEEAFKKNLENIKTFYADKLLQSNLDAEATKLIVDNNQTEILQLLRDHGKDYALIGSTLGQRLVTAFKDKLYGLADVMNGVIIDINRNIKLPSIVANMPTTELANAGVGNVSNTTTTSSITYGSLLSTEKIEIKNGMSIEQLASELAFYMKQEQIGGKFA